MVNENQVFLSVPLLYLVSSQNQDYFLLGITQDRE